MDQLNASLHTTPRKKKDKSRSSRLGQTMKNASQFINHSMQVSPKIKELDYATQKVSQLPLMVSDHQRQISNLSINSLPNINDSYLTMSQNVPGILESNRSTSSFNKEKIKQDLVFLKDQLKMTGNIPKIAVYPKHTALMNADNSWMSGGAMSGGRNLPPYQISDKQILNASVNLDHIHRTPLLPKKIEKCDEEEESERFMFTPESEEDDVYENTTSQLSSPA